MLNVAYGWEAAHHCCELDLAADNETRNHFKPVYGMSFKDTTWQRLACTVHMWY